MQTFALSSPHYTLIHTRTQWLLLYKKWAACLPNWGKVLTQLGHAACPCWAELLSDTCPIYSFGNTHILFPGFCQRMQFLSSEFLSSNEATKNPLFWKSKIQASTNVRFGRILFISKPSRQSPDNRIEANYLSVRILQQKKPDNLTVFSVFQFFVNLGGDNSSISIDIKQFCP